MKKDERCPSCGVNEWYVDYQRTADGEMRVDHCEACDWPPGTPMSPQEWRKHPDNPLNSNRERSS